jgi:hypothetical protein
MDFEELKRAQAIKGQKILAQFHTSRARQKAEEKQQQEQGWNLQ